MTAPSNPYANRWRWWYPAIADYMIAHPSATMQEIATALGRGHSTICLIVTTDLFKDFLARRRKEWEARHDYALREKTTKVAEAALDVIADVIAQKQTAVPLKQLTEIATSALDRLGYSPNKPGPATQVNVQQNGGVMQVQVSSSALEEARDAIKLAQARRAAQSSLPPSEPVNAIPFGEPAIGDDTDLIIDIDPASGLPRAISSD